jgi:hypothetical protein
MYTSNTARAKNGHVLDLDPFELGKLIYVKKNVDVKGYTVVVKATWGPSVMKCNGSILVMIVGSDYTNYKKLFAWRSKFCQLTSWHDVFDNTMQIIDLIIEAFKINLFQLVDYFQATVEERAQEFLLV